MKPGRLSERSLRAVRLGEGVPDLQHLRQEIAVYWDVLLGREDPPIDMGVATLMECAEAYHARASEIAARLQDAEADGRIVKGSGYYHFRTGALRTFMEACKRTIDLGSRRITVAQMQAHLAPQAQFGLKKR